VGPLKEITEIDHPFVSNFFRGERGQRALEVLEDLQRLMPI
jgi:phospholipid/cholesterol/gamma-HCH transport system ATP-binding protein